VNLELRRRMETVSERQRDTTETESVVDKEKKVWSRIWKKSGVTHVFKRPISRLQEQKQIM
jgi:hypothetical protein